MFHSYTECIQSGRKICSICCSNWVILLDFLKAIITVILCLAPFADCYSSSHVSHNAMPVECLVAASSSHSKRYSLCFTMYAKITQNWYTDTLHMPPNLTLIEQTHGPLFDLFLRIKKQRVIVSWIKPTRTWCMFVIFFKIYLLVYKKKEYLFCIVT